MATTPPVKAKAGPSKAKSRKAHPAAKAGGAARPAVESIAGMELESALQIPPPSAFDEDDLARMSLAEPSGVLAPLPAKVSPVPPSAEATHAPDSVQARFETMLETVHRNRPHDDLDLIRRAWEFCVQQHEGQKRASGEPYIIHPLEVCQILADLKMDSTAIAAGLLHDAVEDTDVTSPEIAKRFNEQVAHIVEGVTKLDKIKFANREDHQAENIRKMLLAMVTDVRVVIIKLADRLHNMRTLQHLKPEKQQKIARETLDIYAPLAHRLGMGKLRGELEDLAFQYTDPFAYTQLSSEVEALARGERRFSREHRRGGAGQTRGGRHRGARGVAHQAAVLDSAEADDTEDSSRPGVRPAGHSRDLQDRGGVLRDSGPAACAVAPGAGAHQGLHRDAAPEFVSVAAHNADRRGRPPVRGADSDRGDASHRGRGHRRALEVQGRRYGLGQG